MLPPDSRRGKSNSAAKRRQKHHLPPSLPPSVVAPARPRRTFIGATEYQTPSSSAVQSRHSTELRRERPSYPPITQIRSCKDTEATYRLFRVMLYGFGREEKQQHCRWASPSPAFSFNTLPLSIFFASSLPIETSLWLRVIPKGLQGDCPQSEILRPHSNVYKRVHGTGPRDQMSFPKKSTGILLI